MGAHGFSIREYANKMRSVDVFNCWPFSTSPSVTRHDLQSWLPPMLSPSSSNRQLQSLRSNHHTIQSSLPQPSGSFQDEHASQQSDKSDDDGSAPPSPNLPESCAPLPPSSACDDEKLEMVCPVCREFNAATLTAVNAHIDGCLAQTVREDRRSHVRMVASTSTTAMTTTAMTFKTSKSKVPKKRSIAEIFKVQQQEVADETEEEEVEEAERIGSVLKLWKKDSGGVDESVVDEVSNTVTRFRWLSRRLEALRSSRRGVQSAKSDGGAGVSAAAAAAEEENEEKSEMVCPVCLDFNAATVTAVNAHIDNCLAQAVRDKRRHMRRIAAVVVSSGCSKQKPKAPKKRSIAEILTVAPAMGASKTKAIEVAKDDGEEAGEDNEDEDKSNYSALDSAEAANSDADIVSIIKSKKGTATNKSKKMAKKTKKAKKKSKVEKHGVDFVSMNSEKTMIVNKSKKKKKKSFFNNEMTAKKEDAYQRKVQTSVHSSRKLKGTIGNKMVVLHGIDPSTHEKKLGSKILSGEKKQKVKNFDPIVNQHKAVSPVRGILKNHFKQVSGKISSGSNTQDGTDEYHCNDELFTCKDDVLGPKKRHSFDETMLNKSSDVLPTSLVKEQSSESDEASASFQTNKNYDGMTFNIDKRKETCSVDSKEFSTTLEQATTVPNFLKPCTSEDKSMVLEENSESLTKMAFCDDSNLHPFDGGDATTSHCSPYADISMPLSSVEEVKMPGMNVEVCESGSLSSIRKFIDHLEDPTFQAIHEDSCANTRTFLEPSSSYSASYDKGNARQEFPMQTYGDNDNSDQVLGDRQLSHMFGTDMIGNSFPYTGWGKGSVRSNCQNPNFFGLPLNTHGGLIDFSSSGKLGANQLETSSALQGSLSGPPVNNIFHQCSQESLGINESHVQKTSQKDGLNPFSHYPARLAVSELPCSEREDIHRPNSDMCSSPYVQPLNSEMYIMRSSSVGQDQHDRVLNLNGNGMVSVKESSDHVAQSSSQPTMRLMGKDVPIGRSSKVVQQFAGDNWADEENRRQHYSEYAALENSLPERCSKQDWVSGSSIQMSTYNIVQSTKPRSNKSLPDTVLMNGPDAEFPEQLTDLKSNLVSENGSLPVSRNASSYFHPTAQEHTSCAVFNGAPDEFPERVVPGSKPRTSSQSQVQATPHNFTQPACFSNGELNDRNKSPHVTKLAFEFPFLQTAVNEQAKTSWFERPYRSIPSWLPNSTDERLPVTFSQHFSGLSSQSFPQNSWGNKFSSPSVNHSTEVLYHSIRLNSLGSMKTIPLCPSPVVQPLQVPVTSSAVNSGCRNTNNVTDRVKLDDMITKDHHQHPCANTRKRPASALDDCRKPIKLPNIGVQENMSRMASSMLTGENSSSDMQQNTRAVKLDPHVDGARSRRCQNEAEMLNPTSYPAVDSFKLGGSVTSDPVRLGPRAKHILRSS